MKAKRGRPPKQNVRRFAIGTLYLYSGEDDDLIAFFESLPPRKRRVGLKAALRAGGMSAAHIEASEDDTELLEAVQAFLR